MAKQESVVHSRQAPGFKPFAIDASNQAQVRELCNAVADLGQMGIHLPTRVLGAMDAALTGNVTTPSIPTLLQFLQTWLPGFVEVMTRARKIDELIGQATVGNWEDEEVVQGMLEPTGLAVPYSDTTNLPFASWNVAWETRAVIRFESGLRVGKLEEARAGRMNLSSVARKRQGAALALDIQRNRVGFYGYMNGEGRTFGFLNDPNLPAYVTVTGGTWATKSFLLITADLRQAIAALVTQSGDNIDPQRDAMTLALPTGSFEYLTVTSDFGNSVMDWLRTTYPRIRVVTAPELTGANGGANVFYLYADRVADSGDDNGETFMQIVPARFVALGVEQHVKGYDEGFTNAVAGVMVKRPYAVVRRSGI